jgi:hypothetical protein
MCLSCDNLASLVASSGFRMSRRTFGFGRKMHAAIDADAPWSMN